MSNVMTMKSYLEWMMNHQAEVEEARIRKLENTLGELRLFLGCALESVLDVMECAYARYEGDRTLKIFMDPRGIMDIHGEEEEQNISEFLQTDQDVILFEDKILAQYSSKHVVEVDGVEYLLGPMYIYEIDENGNRCSVTLETIENTLDFIEMNLVEMCMFGDVINAFRMI